MLMCVCLHADVEIESGKLHSRLYQEGRSTRVAEQYHTIIGKFLATMGKATSPTASFTIDNLETYIGVLQRAKLGPSGISKHLGGLATFAAHLGEVDQSNKAT